MGARISPRKAQMSARTGAAQRLDRRPVAVELGGSLGFVAAVAVPRKWGETRRFPLAYEHVGS
jgi:hypothetical protein